MATPAKSLYAVLLFALLQAVGAWAWGVCHVNILTPRLPRAPANTCSSTGATAKMSFQGGDGGVSRRAGLVLLGVAISELNAGLRHVLYMHTHHTLKVQRTGHLPPVCP